MKMLIKLATVLLVLIAVFVAGANQHRIHGWPFNREYTQWVFAQVPSFRADRSSANEIRNFWQIPIWVEKLQKGGYILYFRHAHRDLWPQANAFDVFELATNMKDASQTPFKRAVCLSDQGIEESKMIGKIFELTRIPTGVVVSSPSCRARQTAINAFGRIDQVDNSILSHGVVNGKDFPAFADQLRELLLNVEIKPGTNTVITGHSITWEYAQALRLEGEMIVLEQTGFYIIERAGGDKLNVVYGIRSIGDLARSAVSLPLR